MTRIDTDAVAAVLYEKGIRAKDHHATIRKAVKEEGFGKITKPILDQLRERLEEAHQENNQTVWAIQCGDCGAEYEEERVTSPKSCSECSSIRIIKTRGLLPEGTVLDRRETTGRVIVKIKCTDPQTSSSGLSICKKTRLVATQDLFQVTRCIPCQDRYRALKRAKKARERRKQRREERMSS